MWNPPDNPAPADIRHEGVRDTREGRFAEALQKFLWFHANALRFEEALYGVRLSFALSDWLQLAGKYPPARDAFIKVRDETEQAFCRAPSNAALFHDLASMNSCMGEGRKTADLFETIAQSDPTAAEDVFRYAEDDLIAHGRFSTCNPFLKGAADIDEMGETYQAQRQFEESRPEQDPPIPRFARQEFVSRSATHVALLVMNGREADALSARDRALTIVDDPEFQWMLDFAMAGHLPE